MKNRLYLLICLLVLAGCRNEPEGCPDPTNELCKNFDPCFEKRATADFTMRGASISFPYPDGLVPEFCDTILGSGVEFTALMPAAARYAWRIGQDQRVFTERSFRLGFFSLLERWLAEPDREPFFGPLPIHLTVHNPASACVAAADTLVTTTRQLVFTDRSLTTGTFRGRFEGETAERTLIVTDYHLDTTTFTFPSASFYIIGLPHQDTSSVSWSGLSHVRSYKRFCWSREDWRHWEKRTDGLRVWDQTVSPSATGPAHISVYFEWVIPAGVEVVKGRFEGIKIQ